MITKYSVTGITCEHCVAHITQEVGAIAGVTQVDLDQTGALGVHSTTPVDFALIVEAVAEAGDDYAVTEG